MQPTKSDDMVRLSSIGASNQLQIVQLEAKKNEQLKYINGGQPAFKRKSANDQHSDNPPKQISRSVCKESETNVSQTGKYYWPTDIMHDESGNALKLFKSYIESHKINSYIKLNLEGAIQSQSSSASHRHHAHKNTPQHKSTLVKENSKQEKRSRGRSEGEILRKKKLIKIDYEVVTFNEYENSKQIKNKMQNSIAKQVVDIKLGNHSIYFQSKSSILQKQKDPSNKIHYSHKDSAPVQTTAYNSPVCDSQAPKHRTLDIHDKEHLTPNTSTYFHTTNSLEVRDEDLCFQPNNNNSYRRRQKNRVRVSQFLEDQVNGMKGYDSNNEEQSYGGFRKPKSRSSKQSKQMKQAENREPLQQQQPI